MNKRRLCFSRASFALAVAALCWGGTVTRVAAQQCATFPAGYVPFTHIYATDPIQPTFPPTYPPIQGDIVVGTISSYSGLSSVPLPIIPGQTFCWPIQLAPGFWVTAYVPTAEERVGDFSSYLPTQLLDPFSSDPYVENVIPPSAGVFAWHIVGPAAAPLTVTNANIYRVETYYSQGVLNSGQDKSLVKHLQQAIDLANAGKINGAIQNLQGFIAEVQDLQSSGVLPLAQATLLINSANYVIAELTEEL